MTNEKPISTRDQIKLTDLLLQLGEAAQRSSNSRSLFALSEISSSLAPYADETIVTLFFDLGEYLYELAADIEHPEQAADNGWRDEAGRRVYRSLVVARTSAI